LQKIKTAPLLTLMDAAYYAGNSKFLKTNWNARCFLYSWGHGFQSSNCWNQDWKIASKA